MLSQPLGWFLKRNRMALAKKQILFWLKPILAINKRLESCGN
jgi:hypothetical protein